MVRIYYMSIDCRGARHPSGDGGVTHRNNNSSMLRSRSSQSLRQTPADMTGLPSDERLTVLVQMFWISVSLLESDFEYEFLLAVHLLDKVRSSISVFFNLFFEVELCAAILIAHGSHGPSRKFV